MSPGNRNAGRVAAAAFLGIFGLVLPEAAQAVPAPPPNPSDAEIQAGQNAATRSANQVGTLANQLADAENRLVGLQSEVELKMEDANKARVDLQRAEDSYSRAQAAAAAARGESNAANAQIEMQQRRLDVFAARSYRQGSTLGSVTAYIGTKSPQEYLERASLLDAISGSQLNVMHDLQAARIDKVNKDSLARAALERAEAQRKAADQARATADAAQQAAIQARAGQAARSHELEIQKASVEQQLDAARAHVSGLQQQRAQYQDWQSAKQREEADAAAAAAAAAQHPSGSHVSAPADDSDSDSSSDSGTDGGGAAPASGDVETVVQRALAQVGKPYAWGGGNANGPTRGIRDGGVADSYGDYAKVGFDCSGLMVYAFSAAGISLDHYSGYQAEAGKHVPLSQKQRGDLLFWGDGGAIHHVAMYLGNGKMVEAPYSGSTVRVAPVRYGGIEPYAVRLL